MKKHRIGFWLGWVGLGLGLISAREVIEPQPALGWGEAFVLENDALRLTVVPQTGRIAFLGALDGENLLTRNEAVAGQPLPDEEGDWMNHGGDWMWAVHQDSWETMGGGVWPPLRMMDRPWRGEAWREEDGTQVVVLRRDLAAPVFAQLQRRILLPPGDSGALRVEQSASRIYASPVPVSLWQISQMDGADTVLLGLRPDSPFENGWRHVGFASPADEALRNLEDALVVDLSKLTETKIGTDAHWIAGRRGDRMLVLRTEGGDVGGAFPDGGCSVVMYSNAGLGYTEIETQTVEIDLAPGETFRNVVHMHVLKVDPAADGETLASAILSLIPDRDVIDFHPVSAHPEDVIEVRVRGYESGGILHWGVNGPDGGWALPAEVYWPEGSTAGATGVAVDTPIPDPVDGVSVVRLGPFNDPAQVVTSLHAVARWGDRWESRDGANYNLELVTHPDAAEVYWTNYPTGGVFFRHAVSASTRPAAEDLRLYVNGVEVKRSETGVLQAELDTGDWDYGPHVFKVRAVREGRLSVSRQEAWKIPELEESDAAGLPLGATRVEEGWEVFLHAPVAKFVEIEWKEADGEIARQLMQTAPGGFWVSRVETAADTLQYRYVINGDRRYADPWSRDVLWLTPEGAHSHLPEHAWTLAGALPEPLPSWDRPPMETWVIYELSIPDVAPPGSYAGLEAKLDYMADLGVNAMEPLPVTTFPGDNSWGYNPVFHMGLERSYGTPEEYKSLILAARERGIANVFDIVLNHIEANSPLHRMHGGPDTNPYFIEFDSFNWGFPKLDQESPYFKQYVKDTLEHWVVQWGVDGYRYDATQWIQWSGYNDWGVSWMAYVVNNVDPGVVQIAENLPSEPNMVKGTELDSEWDGHYRWRMRRVFVEGNFFGEPDKMLEILDPRNHAYQNGWQRMQYIESHDEERFVRELLEAGYSREDTFRRHVAAAAVTLTVPGIPMLYAGQEWGEKTPKVVGLNPLQWELREEPDRAAMVEQFRELIHLRTGHRALHHDRIDFLHLDNDTGTMAYLRIGVPESILVAFNVSHEPAIISLPGRWRVEAELLRDESEVSFDALDLLPGEARVFRVTHAE
jgi:1,4-alpha-glucan branching enzyme